MLTASEEDDDLFDAINAGACGYILKNTPAVKFLEFLQDAVQGQVALSSRMASKITNEFKRRSSDEPGSDLVRLTEREKQILELVSQGLTNAEIAKIVYLSEHSVKKYLCSILEKLHMNNRVEAAVYAVREGLLRKEK
jgi:DNA-binding NarL/FixJ family response regulator